MKKIVLALAALFALTGCGAGFGSPSMHTPGFLFSEVSVPGRDLAVATTTDSAAKVGSATCQSILGLIAVGNCGVDAAKKNGNISKISNVEFHVKNILSVYAEYTTKVYGQ